MGKSIESLYLFSSVFMIALLLVVLLFSLQFWVANYPDLRPFQDQAFYLAVGIAIITSIAQWIEGRIKAIMKSVDILAKKEKEIKK